MPWSGCALYLLQPTATRSKCRFASGVDAPQLLNATLPLGHGLAGWVARNRRTLVNADPRVTFERPGFAPTRR